MPVNWTPEQVLDLAPDATSRDNARSLAASARTWRALQRDDRVIWGECQGSGSDPYRCQVDPSGPAFKCSCPSRKTPCKHALGLFLLYAAQPERFETSSPPEWVAAWLTRRAEQSERRAAKAEGKTGKAPDGDAQTRRALERERKIRAGIDDLETWLCDLLRQGLATVQDKGFNYWEAAAARLVDAQAPGLARLVRDMAGICASGDGWQGRLLDQIGRLHLAMEGYRRIDLLPPGTQADLRSVVGITQKQEDVLTGTPVADNWFILGREIEEEFKLKTQRTWLWGESTRRPALILSFAAPGTTLDTSLSPGVAMPAELVFYPGAYPLRAVVSSRLPAIPLPAEIKGCASLVDATAGYAAALAANPWIERFPLLLNGVIPHQEDGEWRIYDADRRCIPLARSFLHGWILLALSGGHPIGMFGEWNGERLLPLSAFAGGEFTAFRPRLE